VGAGARASNSIGKWSEHSVVGNDDDHLDASVAYRLHRDRIRNAISRLTNTHALGMSDDQDEIIQIVFLKLLERMRGGGSLLRWKHEPYVLAVARNAAVDLMRSRRRHVLSAVVEDVPVEEKPDMWDSVTLTALESYIAGLPPELAAVFSLRLVDGLSQVEVCRTLKISRQQLRTLERRVKNGALHAASAFESNRQPGSQDVVPMK